MRVLLTDYLCVSNKDGIPIGHGKKVLSEMYNMLSEGFEVLVYATAQYFEKGPTKLYKEWLVEGKHTAPKNLYQKIGCYYIKLKHIMNSLFAHGVDVVWFTNIDSTLLQVLALLPIAHKKIVITVYRDVLQDSLKQGKQKRVLIRRGLEKCDLVVATNRNLRFKDIKMVYLPDYVYSNIYEKYRSKTKSIELLCIGTIGRGKDITGLIKAVNNTELSLLIAGLFKDTSLYEKCIKIKENNVVVKNCIIKDDEYYSLMGKSKFVVLPYNMEQYACATSGVMQEAVFLGATVIAPKQLLEYNSIQGIGYDTIDQIPNLVIKHIRSNTVYENDLAFFREDNCKRIAQSAILDICSMKIDD